MDAFQTLSTQELYVLQNTVQQELHNREKHDILSAITAHEDYINSCYKKYNNALDVYYYLKVFSSYATSEHHVAVIIFPERPIITYKTNWHKLYLHGDGICGNWDGKLIEIKDILISELDKHWTKIESDEYHTVFNNFIKEIENIN